MEKSYRHYGNFSPPVDVF